MWSRHIEMVSGVLCAALGLFALDRWLFAPPCTVYQRCIDATLWQLQGLGSLWYPVTAFAALTLGIAAFAVWHGLSHKPLVLALLWVCTVLLLATWVAIVPVLHPVEFLTSILTPLPIVGIQIAPILWAVPALLSAMVLALVASIAGTVAAHQRVPAHV